MNPTPLPPIPEIRKPFGHYAAWFSLITAGLVIMIALAFASGHTDTAHPRPATLIAGAIIFLLIFTGLVFGAVGLASTTRRHSPGVLRRSITGLVGNGILLLLFVLGFVTGFVRTQQSRAKATQQMQSAESDYQASLRRSYNSKTGITNFDAAKLDQLRDRITNAMQGLSSGDAKVSEAMGEFFNRMSSAMRIYQAAAQRLRDAKVLSPPTDQSEFAGRRELLHQFMAANDELTGVVTNSETNLRADLVRMNLSSRKIDETMAGYQHGVGTKMPITLQIRECDGRASRAMLDVLDLLESEWGQWTYNSTTDRIRFESDKARAAYNADLTLIKSNQARQIRLQKLLIDQQ